MEYRRPFGEKFAELAYLALFPGFFVYQSALGIGVIPAFLGGYFSPVSVVLAPFLFFLYLVNARISKRFVTGTDLAFWGFLALFFFVVAFNFTTGGPVAVVKHHAVAMLHFAVVFIVFRMTDFSSRRMRLLNLLSLGLMTAIIFHMSADGNFYLKHLGESQDADAVATYQGFARSYIVTFLAVVPFIGRGILRVAIYALSIPALFLNGARSELVAALASIVMIEGFLSRHRLLWFGLPVAIVALLMLNADQIVAALPENRTVQLFDVEDASSYQARSKLFFYALDTIAAHPLFGDYGSYIRILNNAGSYAHNIVSVWVDLGLAGFVYLSLLVLVPMFLLSREVAARCPTGGAQERMFAFAIMFVVLLMLLSSKSFTYMVIAGALGVYANYRSKHGYPKNRASHFRPSASRYAHFHQAMPQPGPGRL